MKMGQTKAAFADELSAFSIDRRLRKRVLSPSFLLLSFLIVVVATFFASCFEHLHSFSGLSVSTYLHSLLGLVPIHIP